MPRPSAPPARRRAPARRRPRPSARAARRRLACRLLTLALCLAAGLAAAAPPAAAEPTVAELEQQIDAAWKQLEPVIEQHNRTRVELAARRKRAAELARRIGPLERQVDAALVQVGQLAALAYKGGTVSALNSVLNSGSPTEFSQRLGVLEQYARRQEQRISGVARLRQQLADQKAPLDRMIAELSRTEAQLAARAKQIDAEIARLGRLRLAAYGNTESTGALRPVPCPVSYPGGRAGTAVRFACAQIGKPYGWGSAGPGAYDCSGLTMAAWARAGVRLPHNAAAQRGAVPSVSRAELRPGDLVFYYGDLHHVAMYAGRYNGTDWIVHAAQAGEPLTMRTMDDGNIHSYGRPG
ncbi:MAG TPA: NlpC/P60 family protein [Pilimelia sp.]|nr:NlpC/P60 family protein [Pilimelia sp.]